MFEQSIIQERGSSKLNCSLLIGISRLQSGQERVCHQLSIVHDIWHLAKCMFDLLRYVIFQYPCIFPHFPSHPSPTPCHTCTHTTALRKKLDALAKEKDCELVGEWKESVINHLYWSAVSTPNGNGELIKAKWISLDIHIINKHRGHGKLFPKCAHKAIKRAGRKKKWFKPRK